MFPSRKPELEGRVASTVLHNLTPSAVDTDAVAFSSEDRCILSLTSEVGLDPRSYPGQAIISLRATDCSMGRRSCCQLKAVQKSIFTELV